ncbi:TIGR02391 family protein [Caulobacter sp. 17J65-9]|uniref:TIGR02391 family protein n=1 Tax=Caulobacter sp. 17J65-9 TaxID=2709382 RepID=UPI0013CBC869|nr:TIGR02391 family protein [Caulobacter sp. 17J65-9]NEX92990.1 TIGR02391 family protein [Caulobacter sp. 17J65-9]
MYELRREIPDADVLLALPAEELAGKVLFLMKRRQDRSLHAGNLTLELADQAGSPSPYDGRVRDVQVALAEAIAWLQGQALLVPEPGNHNGWLVLSRRAREMKDEIDFSAYRSASLLPRELLHPSIREQVWLSFVRGDYPTAVFQAMRQVEIAVRTASGGDPDAPGVRMARRAFNPEDGPLRDEQAEAGERQGMMDLFAGALGALKNPHSHRVVNFDSPAEPIAVILFASQLLRIVENREAARLS